MCRSLRPLLPVEVERVSLPITKVDRNTYKVF
jgi:hypothetical protein